MKNLILIALALAALSSAACHETKTVESRPDYEGTRGHSESSHQSLDKEAKGY